MAEKEKPRLARLTAIITQLQSRRIVTATYLAAKHNVSVRTIYRDIRTLEQSGIPIVTEEGKGYSLMEGYQLPPILFTEEEANALVTAEQLVLKSKDKSFSEVYSNAITKIKAVLRQTQKEKANLLSERVYFGGNNSFQKTSDYLMRIQLAITNFQLIAITYQSQQSEETNRILEPFALYNNQGNWLLIAFCRLRGEFRTFRIDFIESLDVKREVFSPHDMTIVDYFERFVKNKPTPDTPLS